MFARLFGDVRFSLRSVARRPLLAIVVVITLGTSIGGAATIFTFVDGVLLHPLPFPEPDRLVKVCETNPAEIQDWCLASPANFVDWSRRSRTIESFGLARSWPFAWKLPGRSESIRGGYATPGLFSLLGVVPVSGRIFEAGDTGPGVQPSALISDSFWRNRLGADPAALGQILRTDQLEAVVVGILPEGFQVPDLEGVEVWVTFPHEWLERRDWRGFLPFGRLAGGCSMEQAKTEIAALESALVDEYPDANAGYGATVLGLHDSVVAPIRPSLRVFMAAVILVLLIACANVANLLLARTAERQREFAVRAAMGANRRRLVSQLLTENLLLALAGGALGTLLAYWLTQVVLALAPPGLPRFDEVRLTTSTWLFGLSAAALICLFLALVQSTQCGVGDLSEALKTGRSQSGGRGGGRLRNGLVVVEVGLALMLLIGAVLLGRSFVGMLDWRPGFETGRLMTTFITAPLDQYPKGSQVAELFRRTLEEVGAVPGVLSAGATSGGPLFGGGDGTVEFRVEGRPEPSSKAEYPHANRYDMFPSYFKTLGIPLRGGRYFSDGDGAGTAPVAIVNEAAARRYWSGRNPVGDRVTIDSLGDQPVSLEIVGVVADVPPFRPDRAPEPEIYWPLPQFPRWGTQLVVRTSGNPAETVASVRARIEAVEPDIQMGTFRTMDEHVARQLVKPRFSLLLMGVFATMALIIAAVGIYGVVAFSVAARHREIGTRMALGARPLDVFRHVLTRGLTLTLGGVALGAAGASFLGQWLRSLLTAVSATDWISFVAAAALLTGVALAACVIPARRAAKVDPVTVLRAE